MMKEPVKAAKAGEEAAWNVLYQQYYPGLYALALRICGNIPETKDLVQEAYITAYLKLSQLKDYTTFGGWIKKILVRKCYQFLSGKNQSNQNCDSFLPESDNSLEYELEKKLDALSTQGRLYAALTHLPEELRSTLLLRYFSTYQSYKEIASILSIPVGTVRSRLNEAKLKLSEQWHRPLNSGIETFKENSEWNSFYYATFSGMHHHDDCKNQLIDNLHKNVQIKIPGEQNTGKWFFEGMIISDRKFGSWLTPANVISCGNVSVVEARHFNSPEYPNHCPFSSVLVLYRDKGKVSKINLQPSSQ